MIMRRKKSRKARTKTAQIATFKNVSISSRNFNSPSLMKNIKISEHNVIQKTSNKNDKGNMCCDTSHFSLNGIESTSQVPETIGEMTGIV